MFKLRQKIILGFGGLLLIILIIGIQSIVHLSNLGGAVDVILRENYRSVIAAEQMKEALERIDSGLLFILAGSEEQGRGLITRNQAAFEQALKTELGNITLPGEGERAARVRDLFGTYKSMFKDIEDSAVAASARREIYFDRVLPLFTDIKNTADEILHMNQQNMMEANDRARRSAAHARRQMYVLVLAGTALAVVFIILTPRWILRPIRRLIRSAEEIRRGNLDLVVPVGTKDEVGQLSEAFNSMTASLREFRRTDQARLIRIQHATERAFDSLPDTVAVIDGDGRVEVATEPARTIFGLKQGVSVAGLAPGILGRLFTEAMTGGRRAVPHDQAVIQQFVKGEERYFRPEAVPILDNERLTTGVILVLQDVTQLRQQEEIKRGVIQTVSHQLKTPLTSIRMAIHLLLEERVGALTEKQAELLVAAREDSERLNTILQNLLDISRMEAGKVRLEFKGVAPRLIAEEGIEPFRRTAQDQGVELAIDVDGELPCVLADTSRIGHVFANLLSNALKFTPPGGRVTVSAEAGEDVVRFKVADTGPGIPADDLPRVFEPFFRGPRTPNPQGAGLGLAIVKEIVEAHGGTVSAESEEGKGAAIIFTLRRADRPGTGETGERA